MATKKTEEQQSAASLPASYDFTGDPASFAADVREIYYRLRWKANQLREPADIAAAMPDGRTMTLAEVEAALGQGVDDISAPKKCC